MFRSVRLKMLLLSGMAISLAGFTGCTPYKQDQKPQAYSDDGMLGYSNTNPNLPGSPSYHTYTKDTELIRMALEQVEGVREATVYWNGGQARVQLEFAADLPAQEQERVRQQAERAIQHMLPRYEIVLGR